MDNHGSKPQNGKVDSDPKRELAGYITASQLGRFKNALQRALSDRPGGAGLSVGLVDIEASTWAELVEEIVVLYEDAQSLIWILDIFHRAAMERMTDMI